MRYLVENLDDAPFILSADDSGFVNLSIGSLAYALNFEQFKDLRRAVGYVWQDLNGDDK